MSRAIDSLVCECGHTSDLHTPDSCGGHRGYDTVLGRKPCPCNGFQPILEENSNA